MHTSRVTLSTQQLLNRHCISGFICHSIPARVSMTLTPSPAPTTAGLPQEWIMPKLQSLSLTKVSLAAAPLPPTWGVNGSGAYLYSMAFVNVTGLSGSIPASWRQGFPNIGRLIFVNVPGTLIWQERTTSALPASMAIRVLHVWCSGPRNRPVRGRQHCIRPG